MNTTTRTNPRCNTSVISWLGASVAVFLAIALPAGVQNAGAQDNASGHERGDRTQQGSSGQEGPGVAIGGKWMEYSTEDRQKASSH